MRNVSHNKVAGWVLISLLLIATRLQAETLTIQTSEKTLDTPAQSAIAETGKTKVEGNISPDKITFKDLTPGERYDVTLQTKGFQYRLIDLSWYTRQPPETADPMDDDDRNSITQILTDIKTFTNKNSILHLTGDAQHAVALVELIRDSDFHARVGDEIIWRVEVWYFENQAGGWAKVQQQNRVIDRKRFATTAEFEKYRNPLKWIGIPSGLKILPNKENTVALHQK